ncbi:MAG: ABC transporter ATP-binding protein [Cyanobacteriota bacterium]|jgi:ABC-2 type transport system ATP-binding protein
MLSAPSFAIATQGLTKQFNRQRAVNNVDLEVEEGAVYGLIGPNGAGKTTLIRLLAMAEEATTGEITLFGERLIRGEGNLKLKQYLGYLPDDYPLYEDLSIWDYLDYFARLYFLTGPERRRRLWEVLELVQLTSKKDAKIMTLSRGMKQRLSLARTLIHNPLLLLLDEPVSGLDPGARLQFREIVKLLRQAGMTVLISSHVLSDLQELCTAVGVMELGCLIESSPLDALYRRLAARQLRINVLEGLERLQDLLKTEGQVGEIQVEEDGRSLLCRYSGAPEEMADLLRVLVESRIPITEFHTEQEDLESLFFKLGHQQVS